MKARIAAIIDEYDRLADFRLFAPPQPRYMLADIFAILRARGYGISVISDPSRRRDADMAIMHVDATHTPPRYTALGGTFPHCLNVKATDISKPLISEARVGPQDHWAGPVIVKTRLNAGGAPEAWKNRRAARRGRPLPFPGVVSARPYQTYGSLAEVPSDVWSDPALTVDRFLPERLPDGFAMCHYIFCGEYEYCGRFVGRDELVKGKDVFRHEEIPVPQHLRERRGVLGFDYGKFDFVHHEGKACLLDANKTPARIPPSGGASLEGLADGFIGLIETHR